MPFQVMSQTELFLAKLALESLESSVYSVDVALEVWGLSKVLPTLIALVELQFLVNRVDVSVKVIFY